MNRSFNIVWSATRNMFVVAPEFASSNGRLLSHTRINVLAASFLCVSGVALAEDRTFTTYNSGEYKLSGTYLSSNHDPIAEEQLQSQHGVGVMRKLLSVTRV